MLQTGMLNEKEAAEYIGFAVSTLQDWRHKHIGPKYFKIRRTVRYRRCDLDEYIETHLVEPDAR